MATVSIEFGAVLGAGAPVYAPVPRATQTITSSGTSQQSNEAQGGDFVTVVTTGGAIWVAIGQNPTAAAGTQRLLPDGAGRDFGPLKEGDKVAIIDA